jgi:hypothetical protein
VEWASLVIGGGASVVGGSTVERGASIFDRYGYGGGAYE